MDHSFYLILSFGDHVVCPLTIEILSPRVFVTRFRSYSILHVRFSFVSIFNDVFSIPLPSQHVRLMTHSLITLLPNNESI